MKDWLVVFRFIKNYKRYIFLHVAMSLIAAIGSVFTFAMVAPFLKVLFGMEDISTVREPLTLSADSVLNNINYFVGQVIIYRGEVAALAAIIGILIVFSLIRNLFQFLALYCLAPVRSGVSRDLRDQLYGKVLTLPLSYFSKERKGDLIARMTTDVNEIEWSILSSLESFLHAPIELLIFFIVLMALSAKLTFFAIAILPISFFVLGLIGAKLKKSARDAQSRLGGLLNVIEETLSGMRIIKAFTAEDIMLKGFKEKDAKYARVQRSIFRRNF
ncbi:hypothetical protein LJB78_00720, partial [Bacteroidales bacterium OttesenSCG-928-J16]|nr:hypothetical protein [Bacteroidales bacterium OttesenSCG-928-J16]